MRKARRLQLPNDLLSPTHIHHSIRQPVSTANHTVSTDLNQRHGLGITGFESNRRSRGNIQSEAVGLDAIEMQLGIRLDEMIMGSDLVRADQRVLHMGCRARKNHA